MAERLRRWRTISEAQVQFPARAVASGNQAVKYSLQCLSAALNCAANCTLSPTLTLTLEKRHSEDNQLIFYL